MLLLHGHRPYGQCHYYLGRYQGERFHPELHGRMNWPGGQLSGPESLIDDRGRNIFFGWVREARPTSLLEAGPLVGVGDEPATPDDLA